MVCSKKKTVLGLGRVVVVKHTFLEVTESDSDSDDKPVRHSLTDSAVCHSARSSSAAESSSESESPMQANADATPDRGLAQRPAPGSAAHLQRSRLPEASSPHSASRDLRRCACEDAEADDSDGEESDGEAEWRRLRTCTFSDDEWEPPSSAPAPLQAAAEGPALQAARGNAGTDTGCKCMAARALPPARPSSRPPRQPQPHLQVPQIVAVYPVTVVVSLSASVSAPAAAPTPASAVAAATSAANEDSRGRGNHAVVDAADGMPDTVGSSCGAEEQTTISITGRRRLKATQSQLGAERPLKPQGQSQPVEGHPTSTQRTTLMLRNIPNNCTRSHFLALLDAAGFASLYDFVYLPVDFQTGAALGYAFIDLVEGSVVDRFWRVFDGFHRWGMPSKKRCNVSWSDPYQGFEANVEHYRNSPIMHSSVPDSHKPILFRNGVRMPYPAPTKALRAPRIRR